MIKIKNISKKFGDNLVLDDLTVNIKKGEIIAIIGKSGSGKSTFLRCINYLEIPDYGTIEIDGITINARTIGKVRSKVGMVFQGFNLFPHMKVLDNITYPQITVLKRSSKIAIDKALLMLKKVGLAGYESKYPQHLSGGEKQRVAIARALAMDPDVMLFDEPTSALDPEMVLEVLDIIKDLAKTNMTMLIVTHEIKFAQEIADRVLFFDAGAIIEDQPKKTFFTKPKSDKVKWFLQKVL